MIHNVAHIRREQAMEQMYRFENFPGFPAGDGEGKERDREELIRAFQDAARTAGKAKLIGDRLIKSTKFAPRPADIWEAALLIDQELQQPTEFTGHGVKCERCQDMRWISTERDGIRIAERCSCSPKEAANA